MLSVIANIDVMTWMSFAFSAGTGIGTAGVIAIICFIVLLALTIFWGNLWNKGWSAKKTPFQMIWVILFAAICSWSLASINTLYGGHFFRTAVSTDIVSQYNTLPEEGTVNPNDAPIFPTSNGADKLISQFIAYSISDGVILSEPDGSYSADLLRTIIIEYKDAVFNMWGLFILSLLLLFGGSAFFAYREIKMIK